MQSLINYPASFILCDFAALREKKPVKILLSGGVDRIELHRVHFWGHVSSVSGTTEIEMYGSCHPGLRVWQHSPIDSVNHTTGSCGWLFRHFVAWHHVIRFYYRKTANRYPALS